MYTSNLSSPYLVNDAGPPRRILLKDVGPLPPLEIRVND